MSAVASPSAYAEPPRAFHGGDNPPPRSGVYPLDSHRRRREGRVRVGDRARPRPRWQGLDGLRALAVIAVVAYHFWPGRLTGGFLGVDVFFVISGYLITRLLTEEFLARGRVAVVPFYLRRARRLLPALGLVLVVVAAAALIWRDQLATVRGGVLASAVFGANWWLAFDHQSYFVATGRPSMLQHLWSLGIEEQFYLFWPLIVAASLAAGRRLVARGSAPAASVVRRLVVTALGLSVGATVLMWVLADVRNVPYGSDGSTLYFGTETHCMGLLLGAALGAWAAVHPPGETADPSAGRRLDLAAGAALVVLTVLAFRLADYSHTLFRGDFLLISALVAAVIAVATRPDSVIGRALDVPLLRWIGVRSYSIYLWHWPVAIVTRPGLDTTMPTWLDQLLRISATLLLADLTYRCVEVPVRRLGWRRARLAMMRQIRRGWRRLPPRLNVAAPVALGVLGCIAAIVIVVGPAAPRPSVAFGQSAGGTDLALGRLHTPAVGPAQGATRLPKISAFGDSVLLGARQALGRMFAGGSVDAVDGRQPAPILADVRRAAAAGTLHPLVVLHLGNNGLISPDDLRTTLQALSGARVVIVLNDHLEAYGQQWQKPNNATFARVVPEFGNTVLVDWDRIARAHPNWLYGDGLHLQPAGEAAYARLIASTYRAATH
jgi:peptidoglycan/LPS O-acetylase OafA/YrhL